MKRTSQRQRCTVVGCNPYLKNEAAGINHREQTGHRIARWPVRSVEGQRKQRERNRAQALELLRLGVGDDEFYEAHDPGWDAHKDADDD